MSGKHDLIVVGAPLPATLQNAITLWADARTDATSSRRHDLLRDKTRGVGAFFTWCSKHPNTVTPLDVKAWQAHLEEPDAEGKRRAPATVYARISQLSSFYEWLLSDPATAKGVGTNPCKLARPKAPKAYSSESTQALSDDQVKTLLAVVRDKANAGSIVGKRDYALLLLFVSTGLRRAEVLSLTWANVHFNSTITLKNVKVKGGFYRDREVADQRIKAALLDYLEASGRLDSMAADTPLWTSHDRANVRPGKALTSYAFAKNLKRYAREANLEGVHVHTLRHTFARMVSEDTGSIGMTQDALDHANRATTVVYTQRVSVKKDKHSRNILNRIEGGN